MKEKKGDGERQPLIVIGGSPGGRIRNGQWIDQHFHLASCWEEYMLSIVYTGIPNFKVIHVWSFTFFSLILALCWEYILSIGSLQAHSKFYNTYSSKYSVLWPVTFLSFWALKIICSNCNCKLLQPVASSFFFSLNNQMPFVIGYFSYW